MTEIETGTVLFQQSPYGTVDAIVEQDGRTVYFYLQGHPLQRTRACWIANLQTGPLEFNVADLQSGRAPLLPRVHCVDPKPAEIPVADDLQVVWFEEGNGAALLDRSGVLAVIPPWSGLDGFHGYARNCASENQVCWPLPPGRDLAARIDMARQFWQRWIDDPPFRNYQPAALSALEQRFGKVEAYFAIDGGNFPPRGLALLKNESGIRHLATVGMALCPQPAPLADDEPPNYHPWIELGLQIERAASDTDVEKMANRISSLAALPWHNLVWLGAGHTCDFLQDDPGRALARFRDDSPGDQSDPSWKLPTVEFARSPSLSPCAPRLLWLVPEPKTGAGS